MTHAVVHQATPPSTAHVSSSPAAPTRSTQQPVKPVSVILVTILSMEPVVDARTIKSMTVPIRAAMPSLLLPVDSMSIFTSVAVSAS